jgi:hypothetical protein
MSRAKLTEEKMNLKDYFSNNSGLGILSTAHSSGTVNSAIYSRPHFLGNDQVTFIMRDRLTRANLQSNPSANYMFVQQSGGLNGLRINLRKISESDDQSQINKLSRRKNTIEDGEKRFLVSFKVEKVLSLIGGDEYSIN